ncbi:von Willebrand factor type A [Pelomyxa schiedti]|nr:von Willebrand factor type A [Pelomyxa schiedti]
MRMMCSRRAIGGADLARARAKNSLSVDLSTLSCDSVFGNYFFETGEEKTEMFSICAINAKCSNPITHELEYFIGLGLNSKYDGEGLSLYGRPTINVCIVLDVSGSMEINIVEEASAPTKLEVAKNSLIAMLSHLKPEDRFGIITFNEEAQVIQPLKHWSEIDKASLETSINRLEAGGGTDLSVGYRVAGEMMENALREDTGKAVEGSLPSEYRIIFFTDMQPNQGETSPSGLFGLAKAFSDKGIFSTFHGVGLDFDAALSGHITSKIRGASYESIKSVASFRKRMDRDFDYSVTPLLYDMSLSVDPFQRVTAIYGSEQDSVNPASGSLMKIGTVFPSAKEKGGLTMGGLVLLRVLPHATDPIFLRYTYNDRAGEVHNEALALQVVPDMGSADSTEFFQNPGIRKAILLSRFVTLLKAYHQNKSSENIAAVKQFTTHFQSEMTAIGDPALSKDFTILQQVANSS